MTAPAANSQANSPAANAEANAEAFRGELVKLIPHLRAFARSLCGDPAQSDDLAQEALLKAWKSRDAYVPGSNMKAWTFTILRNQYYSETRRSWRRQPLDPEIAESTLMANDDPSAALDLLAVRNGLLKLPDEQREALILAGAGGMSYEEVAEVCGCAVGTVKSRVSRARRALQEILEANGVSFSSDDDASAADAFDDIVREARELGSGATSPG